MSDESEKNIPTEPSEKDLEEILLKSDPQIFDEISEHKRKELVTSLKRLIHLEITQSISKSFSGPLPPPDILEHYIRIAPDFADSIVKMAVDEQKYSHNRDNKLIEESFSVKRRGQIFALTIALVAIIGGVICILHGFQVAGSIVSGVGLSGLVSEFLGRKREDKQEDGQEDKP